ncbi:MAG: superoxide dismutase family protein, partial [Pseudomonadota bacterium]
MMRLSISVAAVALLLGCQGISPSAPRATANLQPTKNGKASGTVDFYEIGGKVRVIGKISSLVPGRQHGFHIHEAGDCSSGDGMSTKGHFNPLGKSHAHHGTIERHAGDLPSLKSDAGGNASLTIDLDVISVAAGPTSIVGRGLIVHVQPDD